MFRHIDCPTKLRAALTKCTGVSGRLMQAVVALTPRQRLACVAAVVVCGGLAIWAVCADHSRALTKTEIARVIEWVGSTQSEAVRAAFERRYADGRLTLDELGEISELSKGASLPRGLYQPVVLDR